MSRFSNIEADLFKSEHEEASNKRIVIFLSDELLKFVDRFQKDHKMKSRSTAIRFIVRCCGLNYKNCNSHK